MDPVLSPPFYITKKEARSLDPASEHAIWDTAAAAAKLPQSCLSLPYCQVSADLILKSPSELLSFSLSCKHTQGIL